MEQYAQNEKKILVAKSESIRVRRGNIRGRQVDGKQIDIRVTHHCHGEKKKGSQLWSNLNYVLLWYIFCIILKYLGTL